MKFNPEEAASKALAVPINDLRIVQANHSVWGGITYAFACGDGSAYVVFQKLPRRRWIERIIDNTTRTKRGRSPKIISERFVS
jgi:hypothetical protein